MEKRTVIILLFAIVAISSLGYYIWHSNYTIDYYGCQSMKGYLWDSQAKKCVDRYGYIQEKVYCPRESRSIQVCAEIYEPVCGWFNPKGVQCIKYPCAETFGNSCSACGTETVEYYTKGKCPSS